MKELLCKLGIHLLYKPYTVPCRYRHYTEWFKRCYCGKRKVKVVTTS